jgi:hypothetical protein
MNRQLYTFIIIIFVLVILACYFLNFDKILVILSLIASLLAIFSNMYKFEVKKDNKNLLSDKLSVLENHIEDCKFTPQLLEEQTKEEEEEEFQPQVGKVIGNADDGIVNYAIKSNRYLRSIEDQQKNKRDMIREWYGEELDAEEDRGWYEDPYFYISDEEVSRWENEIDPTSAAMI